MPRSTRPPRHVPAQHTFPAKPLELVPPEAAASAPTQFSNDEDERNKEAKWLMLADKVLGPVEGQPAKIAK